jgi:CHAT domain-containing protein
LATEEFDLIQFFCHGHTKLQGVSDIQETATKDDPGKAKAALVQASYELNDSLLELSGGLVTLSKLKVLLRNRLLGHPIVFLSMCESAQVSASGTGFVPMFLSKGARTVIGTEGPSLWSLSREMDTNIVKRLLEGRTISQAFYETRRELAKKHMLALIYTLYGDADVKFDLNER